MRRDPEAPAALGPAVAEVGSLMDVRFIKVDQDIVLALGTGEQTAALLDKGLSALRVGPAEQLAGLLPGQLQAMEGDADRLAAAGPAEPLAHPADQAAQGPAWRRIGPGYGRGGRGVLGGCAGRRGRPRPSRPRWTDKGGGRTKGGGGRR